MRLAIFDHGQRPRARAALRIMRLVARTEPDPVIKMMLYRPSAFGRPWAKFVRSVMRGPSPWSYADRELIGAYVSRLNSCRFCAGVHDGTAGLLLGEEVTARLDNPQLAATLTLLEKITLSPDDVQPGDVAPVRATGVSDEAITDALYVCFLFNTVNRLASAFGFSWETDADRLKLARMLNLVRYQVPGILLR